MQHNLSDLIEAANKTGEAQTFTISPTSESASTEKTETHSEGAPPSLSTGALTNSVRNFKTLGIQGVMPLPLVAPNPIDLMAEANHAVAVAKQFKKNLSEQERASRLQSKRRELALRSIVSLTSSGPSEPSSGMQVPQELFDIVNRMHSITVLDKAGLLIALLGAFSIATQGRITIKCDSNWSEAAVDMILQVADSGMRKTSAASILRKPFEAFQSEKNILISCNHELKKETLRQRKKVASAYVTRECRDYLDSSLGSFPTKNKQTLDLETLKALADWSARIVMTMTEDVSLTTQIQLFIDRGTPHYTARLLQAQGECIAVITDEGGILQSSLLGREGDPNLFLKSHAQSPYCEPFGNIQLNHPAMPMIHFVQTIVAVNVYGNKDTERQGVTERFVPYIHQRIINEHIHPVSDDQRVFELYNKKIFDLLELYHTQDKTAERYTVSLTPKAYGRIKVFESEVSQLICNNPAAPHANCLLKAHGQAVRFAWDFHAWRYDIPHEHLIDVQEMDLGTMLSG